VEAAATNPGDRGLDLSRRCRTEKALTAVEQAVLNRLPAGSRDAHLTLTTDNGTQFTSARFLRTLSRLGITHRRTAYHHPKGSSTSSSSIAACRRNIEEARAPIGRWIADYNHNRPHQSLQNRTPHEAFLAWEAIQLSEAPNVQF
jgi:putative transposase